MTTDVLVTGTGRCGTGFWTAMLRQAGLAATHEGFFSPRGYHPPITAELPIYEQSWMGAPHLDWWKEQEQSIGRDRKIILLYRDPVAVVRSMLGIGFFEKPRDPYQRYANRHSDAWVHWPFALKRACYFWSSWNLRILPFADSVQYVMDPDYSAVCDWYGLSETAMEEAASKVGDKVNSRQRADLDDEDTGYILRVTGYTWNLLEGVARP